MGIEKWSTSPGSNNLAPPDGWPGGMLPSQVEPTGRQMMASLASWYQAAEWINYNFTPVYISGTQFSIASVNVTGTYHVGRRVQATDGATSVYGTITASAFTTLTTVTVIWDSGVLQTGVTIVYVGITSFANTSAPALGTSAFANPATSVGLTATNGTATTAMRSDAAPALSQAIAPTWTGNHIFRTASATGTEGMKLDNSAGDARFGLYSAGTEYGLLQAATNVVVLSAIGASTTLKLAVNNGVSTQISSAGNVTIAAPSGADTLVVNGVAGAVNEEFTAPEQRFRLSATAAGGKSYELVCGGGTAFTTGNFYLFDSAAATSRLTLTPTGNFSISGPSSGEALSVAGLANNNTARFTAPNAASQSFGPIIIAGTNTSDRSLLCQSAAAVSYFLVRGDGVVFGNDGTSLFELGYKGTPLNTQGTNYTAVVADKGKTINASATINVTIPNSVFSAGDVVTVSVGSGATVTIVQGSGVTLQWAGNGATTGSRTLTGAGLATLVFLTSSVALISGAGLS